MNLDFRLAKASDFLGIQQIFKHYLSNTAMVLTRDIPSILENLQDNMPFPDEGDNAPAFSTYLPVPVLVARDTASEKKPRVVGYAFLGPCRKSTMGDASSMELFLFVHPEHVGMGIGGALLSMLLMLVQSERGVGVFEWVVAEGNGSLRFLRHADRVRRVVAAVSIDPEGAEGGEWLPKWLEGKGFKETRRVKNMALRLGKWVDIAYLQFDAPGDSAGDSDSSDKDSGYGEDESSEAGSVDSEGSIGSDESAASYGSAGSAGSQGSQGSQTSVSSEENDSDSDSDEDSEDDEDDDWDDEDDPYGEVEDDDMEFD